MTVQEVRRRYLNFMRARGHHILSSSSLVPKEDATTLFTGSGMQPLIPFLLGKEHPHGFRLANSQKCFRSNDVDEVGDNRHTTFFEMLGNWSLGDYFRKEQIGQCFAFLTTEEGLNFDPSRLYVTVFAGDEQFGIERDETSAEIWRKLFEDAGVSSGIAHIGSQQDGDVRGMKKGERIFYYDASKNWWSRAGIPEAMPPGEPGGPDTEVFYDFGEEYADKAYNHLQPHPNSDSGRFAEICNSVFMEYVRTESGFAPLKKKNVDFGGGLERLAAATTKNPDIFTIDVFSDAIAFLETASGKQYAKNPEPFRVIADHMRSALFAIADGVSPSNTDRGYVVRRLLRKAIYSMQYQLSAKETRVAQVARLFIDTYKEQYPEVAGDDILSVIADEENQFTKTLKKGMQMFEKTAADGILSGNDAFLLQSTYGFPFELTEELARQRGITVQKKEYERAMKDHKEKSRQASKKKFKGGLEDTSEMSVKYHTATHLLHAALREVLGDSVEQKGSNITPERMRFDFSHPKKVSEGELQQVENLVNQKIKEGLPVSCRDMPREEAEKEGALGVFEYGDTVRVYSMGDFSKELCGGPHVGNTAELGVFSIVKEKAVASGVRRIRAVLR